MENDAIVLAAMLMLSAAVIIKRKRERTVWKRDWIKNRQNYGAPYHALMNELKSEDANAFKNFIRMD